MMNRKSLICIAVLVSSVSTMAQSRPDEINYEPYYQNYTSIESRRDETADNLSSAQNELRTIISNIEQDFQLIDQLDMEITNHQRKLANLKSELPIKRQKIQQTKKEHEDILVKIDALKVRRRDIKSKLDNMAPKLSALQTQKQTTQKEVSKFKKAVDQIKSQIQTLKKQKQDFVSNVSQLKKKIVTNNQEINRLTQSKSTLEEKIVTLNTQVSDLKITKSELDQKLVKLKNKAQKTRSKIDAETAKLATMRSRNATDIEIKAQMEAVKQLKGHFAQIRVSIQGTNSSLSTTTQKMKSKKIQITKAKQTINQLPAKIQGKKDENSSLESKVVNVESKIQTTDSEISRAITTKESRQQDLAKAKVKLDSINVKVSEMSTKVSSVKTRLQEVKSKIKSNVGISNELTARLGQLRNRVQQIKERIPKLKNKINNKINRISSIENGIQQQRVTKREVKALIVRLNKRLEHLTSQTDDAHYEYEIRYNLYHSHKKAAAKLGESQIGSPYTLGKNLGSKMAISDANSYGTKVGQDVGRFYSNMIALVRSEITGYAEGYKTGYADSASISQAKKDGLRDGKNSAFDYAQKVFKPAFFEEFILSEIAKPVSMKKMKSMMKSSTVVTDEYVKMVVSRISDLTQREIDESMDLITSLDPSISSALGEEDSVLATVEDHKDYNTTYISPASVPYASTDCSQVYKGLKEFKDVCRSSYVKLFSYKYHQGCKQTYAQMYQPLFEDKFEATQDSTRESNYDANYASGYKVSFNEAKLNGKKDVYDDTYAQTFEDSYNTQLPIAEAEVKVIAKSEVSTWIANNSVVTVSGKSFSSPLLRGGDTGTLVVDLKNISQKSVAAAGSLKIESSQHLIFDKTVFPLGGVNGKSVQKVSIPFTVSTNAGSKDLMQISASVKLPGDKYKTNRIEKFDISQNLALNPKSEISLNYDSTPRVKGVFKYKIHTFTTNITPLVESLPKGYSVSLKVVGEHKDKIKFKKSSIKTSSTRRGQRVSAKLSYSFSKSAKKKQIELELVASYQGLVLKKEKITLSPK